MDLTDKVVLITGGGTGIGKETARQFAEAGSKVYICGRREKPLEEVADGERIKHVSGDVTKLSDIGHILHTIFSYNKDRIDILVNNAGTFEHNHALTDTSFEQWNYVMDENFKSVYFMSKHVLPHMINQRSGVIINVGSVIASTGAPNASAYIASKGAVIALTKSMAVDYANYGIRVNSVSPSMIRTDMTKNIPISVKREIMEQHTIQRLGEPKDVAEAILYLAKADWITGEDLKVDGGVRLG